MACVSPVRTRAWYVLTPSCGVLHWSAIRETWDDGTYVFLCAIWRRGWRVLVIDSFERRSRDGVRVRPCSLRAWQADHLVSVPVVCAGFCQRRASDYWPNFTVFRRNQMGSFCAVWPTISFPHGWGWRSRSRALFCTRRTLVAAVFWEQYAKSSCCLKRRKCSTSCNVRSWVRTANR